MERIATGESLVEPEENERVKQKHDPLLKQQNYQGVSGIKRHAGDAKLGGIMHGKQGLGYE